METIHVRFFVKNVSFFSQALKQCFDIVKLGNINIANTNRKEKALLKKHWLLMLSVFLLALMLAACGGNDNDADTNTGNNDGGTTEQTDDGSSDADQGSDEGAADATSYDAEAAQSSYQSCAGCHGGNLEGGSGPKLSDVGSRLSKDEILDAIVNGRTGMPPGLLKGDEAENVAAWLADQK